MPNLGNCSLPDLMLSILILIYMSLVLASGIAALLMPFFVKCVLFLKVQSCSNRPLKVGCFGVFDLLRRCAGSKRSIEGLCRRLPVSVRVVESIPQSSMPERVRRLAAQLRT